MNSGIWNWLWWYLLGIVIGGGTIALWFSVKDKVTLKWYEWVLSMLTILLFAFTLQTVFGSFAEYEAQAAWMSLVFLGIPTIILVVITMRSVQTRVSKLK